MPTTYSLPQYRYRMSWSSAFAVIVHLCVLFGIGLSLDVPQPPRSSLEITLATKRSSSEPEQADFLAQENQAGSGTLDEVRELTTTAATRQQAQSGADAAEQSIQAQRDSATATDRRAIVKPAQKQQGSSEQQPTIESIQAKLDRQRQQYSRRPRIHRMTSVATRQSDDARYQLAWQQRVERVGNQHYPAQARQQRLSGDVRLVVALLPDGSIKEIKVLVSSGQQLLDQAAIRSVRLAAPFEPFPAHLREKADILEIIRTWQFRNNVLTST